MLFAFQLLELACSYALFDEPVLQSADSCTLPVSAIVQQTGLYALLVETAWLPLVPYALFVESAS